MSIHIQYASPSYEISREIIGERWCFRCRKRCDFAHIVRAQRNGADYYGPSHTIRCANCTAIDGDLFPGRERIWND
jgi:hypothetical protein